MSARILLAVSTRVLTQLRRDRRTAAMLLVLPCVLITLLWWMFKDLPGDLFDRFGPGLLAIFPFIVMFLVTSVTTLPPATGRDRAKRIGVLIWPSWSVPASGIAASTFWTAGVPPAFKAITALSRSSSVVQRSIVMTTGAVTDAPPGVFTDAVAL